MRKKFLSILLCVLILAAAFIPASADTLPRVVDNAGLLTDSEISALEKKATSYWDAFGLDVAIVTVNSLDGKTAMAYADDYYDEQGYGYGSDYSGILLLLAMDTREWYITTCGKAISIFTDRSLDEMGQEMLPDLSSGRYYDAFDTWLELIPQYCVAYDNAIPLPRQSSPLFMGILSGLAGGILVAVIAVAVMCFQMRTARAQQNATQYIQKGSYHLHTNRDLYLYSHVSRTRRQDNSSGGGRSGSSTHRSSSGRSHGGRGGKF